MVFQIFWVNLSRAMSDKQSQNTVTTRQNTAGDASLRWPWRSLGLMAVAIAVALPALTSNSPSLCAQAAVEASQDQFAVSMLDKLNSNAFRERSIRRLAGAIQIPTVAYDDMGPVDQDPRWNIFDDFAGYLETTFPSVHEKLKLEKVNTHGLLYTWTGSDATLKPTVLTRLCDVIHA